MKQHPKYLKPFKNLYVLALIVFSVWMLFFDTHSYLLHREINEEIEDLENEKAYYKNEMEEQEPFEANWDDIDLSSDPSDEILKQNLLEKFKINYVNDRFTPQKGVSLKPYVLLFDEIYTDLYRISEAEDWMNKAQKIIFIGTSFSVNITSIAVRISISRRIKIDIVEPNPIKINYDKVNYHQMNAEEYSNFRNLS